MNSVLQSIASNLDNLHDSILAIYSADTDMLNAFGWQYPPLTRSDLAYMSKSIADKLRYYDIEYVEDDILQRLEHIPDSIVAFQQNTLNYFFNGYGHQSFPAYFELISYIKTTLEPLFSWEALQDTKAMPKELARRLRGIQADLNEIVPEKDKLRDQIDLINKATAAAETLPTDLESLKEARAKVNNHMTEAAQLYGKIDSYNKDSEKVASLLKEKLNEAEKIVSQCNQAYRIATTEGLAAAFDQRAKKLTSSVWYWVIGLLIALGGAIFIGHERFETINKALQDSKDTGKIWIQIFLSVLSLGAPIWFAWIATKQINQRFKLAEDYSFKASVAKAYEGYKAEAARLDENLENRLFGSALSRLEEAPLRLLDNDHYSSPWQELLDSPKFKEIWSSIPELKDIIIERLKKTSDKKVQKAEEVKNKQ